MRRSVWASGFVQADQIRRLLLGYGALISGLALVWQFLIIAPGLNQVPAPYFLPFLPVTFVGLIFWVISGRTRESLATLLILALVISWGLQAVQLNLVLNMVQTVLMIVALSALIVYASDWILACRLFLLGYIVSIIFISVVFLKPSVLGIASRSRFGFLRTASGANILDPNHVAFQAGFAVLLSVFLLAHRRRHYVSRANTWLALIGLATGLSVVLLTQSRGGLLAVVGAVGVMVIFGGALFKRKTWIALIGSLVGAATYLAVYRPAILERFQGEDATGSIRTEMWVSAFNFLIKDTSRLFFGEGTMQGGTAFGRYSVVTRDFSFAQSAPAVDFVGQPIRLGVHNGFVNWMLDYGLVGSLIGAIALALAVIRAVQIDRHKELALGLGMITYYGLVSMTYISYELYTVTVACGGMSVGYLYFRREFESYNDDGRGLVSPPPVRSSRKIVKT